MGRIRKLTWPQVWGLRLARHGLSRPVPPRDLARQVGVMCGAHAQVMSAAELSIGLRVEGSTRRTVREALSEDRSLVKAFGPRGTVHLVASADLPMWNAVLGAALNPPNLPPDLRMDTEQTDAVVAAIDAALADAELTLEELDAEVVRRAGAWAGERVMPAFQEWWPRWRQAERTAAFRGVLCFGPNRGQKVTYTSPRRWLGAHTAEDPSRAGRLVLQRYLHAYGPATPEHLARWLGGSPPGRNSSSALPPSTWRRSTSKATPSGCSPAMRIRSPKGQPASGSCPTSTPMPSAAIRANASFRDGPRIER